MRFLLALVLLQSVSEVWSQSDPVQDLSQRWSDFGIRLFRSVGSGSDQNLLLSPSGTGLSLVSVLERSAGTGREQLEAALGVQLQSTDPVSSLREAVGVASLGGVAWFVAEGAEPDDAYRKQLQSLGIDVRTLNLDSIQSWVLDQTSDRVQVQRPDLGPDPQLVLVSALKLTGQFSVPFNVSLTTEERFFVDRYHTVTVAMMTTCGRFLLAYDRDLQSGVLRLELGAGSAMFVVLPDEGTSLSSVEEQLSGQRLLRWLQMLRKTRLEVQLPRFVLENSVSLKRNLRKLQISQVFADNSLSQVIDAVSLSVDETSAPGGVASSFKTPPPRLTVNRPFLLVVYHEATGTLQMIGRVVDPTKN